MNNSMKAMRVLAGATLQLARDVRRELGVFEKLSSEKVLERVISMLEDGEDVENAPAWAARIALGKEDVPDDIRSRLADALGRNDGEAIVALYREHKKGVVGG